MRCVEVNIYQFDLLKNVETFSQLFRLNFRELRERISNYGFGEVLRIANVDFKGSLRIYVKNLKH
jgi:hypothetical protein